MIKWARLVASSGVTVLHAHCTLKRYKKHSDKHPLNERIKKLHHYCKKLCDGLVMALSSKERKTFRKARRSLSETIAL